MTHDDALDRAADRVAALQAGLAELNTNIDTVLSRKKEMDALAEDVGGLRTYGQRSRAWIWVTVISLVLNSVFTGVLWYSAHHADDASRRANAAIAEVHRNAHELCLATGRSWDNRTATDEALTSPTVLSPEVEKLFPSASTESLRLQIAQSNAVKARQRAQLAALNGPRPLCP